MPIVLGIDLGTQSLKALIYDTETKTIVANASSPVEIIQSSNGAAEQKAEWWLAALEHCFAQLSDDAKQRIAAVGVSGQQHGFVPVGTNGDVLANVKLWCDTTTSAECEEIMSILGGREACVAKTGNAIVPGYTAPKILWLKKHKPDAYAQMCTVMLPHDYLNFHLGGVRAMEFGDASGTGLLDIENRRWHSEAINAIDDSGKLAACLPPLHEGLSPIGAVTKKIADRYGIPAGIPISPGGGDNMMGAIGTGNVGEGIVTMSLGSSGTAYASSDKAVFDSQERLAAFCSSTGGWLPLLCTMNCTLTTELTRNVLDSSLVEMEALVAATPIGSHGVLTMPFFNGERIPNLPQAKGNILGLDSGNYTRANLLRSAMEGATFGLKLGMEALDEAGMEIREIRLIGGGSKSASWRQIVADICNAQVVGLKQDEGAAFGAALQAFAALQVKEGRSVDIGTLTQQHVTLDRSKGHQPVAENVLAYTEVYEKYKQAVGVISQLYAG